MSEKQSIIKVRKKLNGLPLYLSSVHSELMAVAACCTDTGSVTQRPNIRENRHLPPVASVVGSTPTHDATEL